MKHAKKLNFENNLEVRNLPDRSSVDVCIFYDAPDSFDNT